jgi:UDP-2-acetamido-3-amino-2,3-dideoxy-glucuronate N-acetyltransferase
MEGGRMIEVDRWFGGAAVLYRAHRDGDRARGSLVAFDLEDLPFVPRRVFVVRDVPAGAVRGGHAHARGEQLLVCSAGEVAVELRREGETARVVLDTPTLALLVRSGVWARQTYEGPDTVLAVLATTPYDPASYVSDPS